MFDTKPKSVTIAWTGDYRKKPCATFGGFSIIDKRVNAASSSYHFMNAAFFGEESIFNFKTNCPDTFHFLNGNSNLVDAKGNTIITKKEVIVDLSCAKTLLSMYLYLELF